MKAKRVECDKCVNFIKPAYEEYGFISPMISKAKCKLGKRVMFRMPIFANQASYTPIYDGGYIRYCNDFKPIENE